MVFNPLKHHRRSIRLRGYDYSRPGLYYVTLTLQSRLPLLGEVQGDVVHLSVIGEIVKGEWLRTPIIRPGTALDEFVVMPDHVHGIIVICEERNGVSRSSIDLVGANSSSPRRVTPFRSPSKTLGAIIRGFKAASTVRINEHRGTPGTKIWQRNYYEHIIRDERDLLRIQEYIRNNPLHYAERLESLGRR